MSAKRIETNKCKLILLRGNSGSGKTPLAHMLQHKLDRGTLVLSQDVIRSDGICFGPKTPRTALRCPC